jgi:hypothetical protein
MQDFKKMNVSQTYHEVAGQDQQIPKKSVVQLLSLVLTILLSRASRELKMSLLHTLDVAFSGN